MDVREWIITVENNTKTLETLQSQPPKLHKVPDILRKPTNIKHFIPEVVSLGPYHHLSPHLHPMEDHKMAAMMKFIDNDRQKVQDLLGKIKGVAKQPKDWYVGMDHLGDDEFARMMLVDACFILYFIQNFGMAEPNPKEHTRPISPHLCGFITRDIFLLENQIPYCIIKELMKFKFVDLEVFIDKLIGKEGSNRGSGIIAEPLHLLDLLHSRWIGKTTHDYKIVGVGEPSWSTFRSVMELKEAGISIGRSTTRHLTDVRFNAGYIRGKLTIPTFVVDDVTKSRLLNLVALEMQPGRPTANGRPSGCYVVTSYICFLDNLIDHADDVKELRLQGVLYNALGTDKEVADLFNELAVNLVPDHRLYSLVVKGLDSYYNRKYRVSIVRMLNTHFSSPWSAISFVAAVVLLVLTFLQTLYSIMGNGK